MSRAELLDHIERLALRIANNPLAHAFDKDAAVGIVELCRNNRSAKATRP